MPYHWTHDDRTARLELWPYRSLPKKGFVLFIGATAGFLALPLFAVLGSTVLWALLPFLALAVGAIWWALAHSYRTGEVLERLAITPDSVTLTRHDPKRPNRDWSANPHWVRAELHPKGGPVPNYLTLKGGPRLVELGAFLTPEERRSLYDEVNMALMNAGRPQV
jgi:uncharacterized membrane protein